MLRLFALKCTPLLLVTMLNTCIYAQVSEIQKRVNDVRVPNGLSKIHRTDVLHSSDLKLSVWNYNEGIGCGEGGTMVDISQTFRWFDTENGKCEPREWIRGGEIWVEQLATFKTSNRTVYVVIGEGKWTTQAHSTRLTAYEIKGGEQELKRVHGFFPQIPGTSEDGAGIEWQYERIRGDWVFPRPFEVRADEEKGIVTVYVFPRQSYWSSRWRVVPASEKFSLSLQGDKMVSLDFADSQKRAVYSCLMNGEEFEDDE